jgi:hypothetical protein
LSGLPEKPADSQRTVIGDVSPAPARTLSAPTSDGTDSPTKRPRLGESNTPIRSPSGDSGPSPVVSTPLGDTCQLRVVPYIPHPYHSQQYSPPRYPVPQYPPLQCAPQQYPHQYPPRPFSMLAPQVLNMPVQLPAESQHYTSVNGNVIVPLHSQLPQLGRPAPGLHMQTPVTAGRVQPTLGSGPITPFPRMNHNAPYTPHRFPASQRDSYPFPLNLVSISLCLADYSTHLISQSPSLLLVLTIRAC